MSLKEQVEQILRRFPKTRNSDTRLKLKIWDEFYDYEMFRLNKHLAFKARVQLHQKLPEKDAVKRIRAKFQNDEGKYLPTSWEVAKRRDFNEHVWRRKLGYPPKSEVEDPNDLSKDNKQKLV